MSKETEAEMTKRHLAERGKAAELDAVHPQAAGFAECVTPIKPPEDVFFFRCECKSIHYRHAGYIKTMDPFMRSGGEKKVAVSDLQVMVCVKCKNSYAWVNEQMYNISHEIDVKAWEEAERTMHATTGPGGQC